MIGNYQIENQYHNYGSQRTPNSRQQPTKNSSVANIPITSIDYEKLINIEIQNAKFLIQKTKIHLPFKNYNKDKLLYSLRIMEEDIFRKNKTIKELENQISILKNKSKEYNQVMQNKIINITGEIKQNCIDLKNTKQKLQKKKYQYASKNEQTKSLFQKYSQKCKFLGIQVVDFQKFKNQEFNKKRQQQARLQKLSKKKLSSIYQNTQIKKVDEQNKKSENKTYKQSLMRKNVAEAALKNQKKKHRQQMNNFLSKIQFLKDQYAQIQFKISAKQKELHAAQKKFTQNAGKYGSGIHSSKSKGIKLKTMN